MTPFNNKPESSSDFTILIRSSISLFDIISVVLLPDPNIFLCIPASAADAAAVNPKGINALLANGVITLLMDQVIYLKILLSASFLITELLKI